jgi:hypothetical protein
VGFLFGGLAIAVLFMIGIDYLGHCAPGLAGDPGEEFRIPAEPLGQFRGEAVPRVGQSARGRSGVRSSV